MQLFSNGEQGIQSVDVYYLRGMNILYIKALHIIFVVTWFAGLFYIVRLFIYFVEAEDKPPAEKGILQKQFAIMQKRLWYGITWPSAILAMGSGLWLVYSFGYWNQPWMQLKLGMVAGLFLYHLACGRVFRQLMRGVIRYSSTKLRIWNEVATLFLVAIVFIIVMRDSLSWIWGVAGLVLFAVVLMLAIRMYRRARKSSESQKEEQQS